jgi:hypothetical protein
VLRQLDRLMKPEARGAHIMPCGNEGSYLHGLALLRTDGINAAMGNRFFYDEEGHVRRLRTDDPAAEYRRSATTWRPSGTARTSGASTTG